jgi:hypothetical protein
VKNFPHQFNDLGKLTAALNVAATLIGTNQQYSDDGVFGAALAKAGIYSFRNRDLTVAQNLALESAKPLGSQGFRTAARDIRRFFALADLVRPAPALSQLGSDILAASGVAPLRNALWREAMLQLALADAEGNASHPYRILLRLVADRPGIETSKLLLALEARDDSPAEYVRVLNLADQALDDIIATVGVGVANARNAVKILPGIAEQVGDISRVGTHTNLAETPVATEDALVSEGPTQGYEQSGPVAPVEIAPDDIAPIPNFGDLNASNVDLTASIEIRRRRTIEHQRVVVSVAQALGQSGYQTYANPYDCLGYRAGVGGILIEVKTLDGTRSDERRQAEKAFGQLRGYGFFSVPAQMKAPRLVEVVAYSAPPCDTIPFMAANNVCSAWREGNQWVVADPHGNISNFDPDALLA